jgi:hypothetical protein
MYEVPSQVVSADAARAAATLIPSALTTQKCCLKTASIALR